MNLTPKTEEDSSRTNRIAGGRAATTLATAALLVTSIVAAADLLVTTSSFFIADAFLIDPNVAAPQTPPSTGRLEEQQQRLARSTHLQLTSDDAELLSDLPFVPKEVMAKFLKSVGDPLTTASLRAGYEAGAISNEELLTLEQNGVDVDATLEAQSKESIEAAWNQALEDQPWLVKSVGKVATKTIVPLVQKMQTQAVEQANAMTYINREALLQISQNEEVVGLLTTKISDSSALEEQEPELIFNNTRAKYEDDRGVWSASMDVFVKRRHNDNDDSTSTSNSNSELSTEAQDNISNATAALAALQEGMSEEMVDTAKWSVGVLEELENEGLVVSSSANESPPENERITSTGSDTNNKDTVVGLVNAYFVPNQDVKILVVEIDGILHNVTWKGLPDRPTAAARTTGD